MLRTAQQPYNLFIGLGLILIGVIVALAPLPILHRSLGLVLCITIAFAHSGPLPAYIIALLCPLFGLEHLPEEWLIMLPVVLSTQLLTVMGIDYGWRYGALVIAPLLASLPIVVAWQGAQHTLFNVTLPWQFRPQTWLIAHSLVVLGGVVLGLVADGLRAGLFDRFLRRGSSRTPNISSGSS